MNRKPWFMFFAGDWIKGTRRLKPDSKAVWIDLLAYMWENEPRGEIYDTAEHIGIMLGMDYLVAATTINDLVERGFIAKLKICAVCAPGPFDEKELVPILSRSCPHLVPPLSRLMSRRMSREARQAINNQNKQQKLRERERIKKQAQRDQKRTSDVTLLSHNHSHSHKKKDTTDVPPKLTPQAELVSYFQEAYKELSGGQDYRADKKDFVIMSKLVKDNQLDLVKAKIDTFANSCFEGIAWYAKGKAADFTIGKLMTHWNSLLAQQPEVAR